MLYSKDKVIYIFLGPSGSGKSKLGFQLRKFNIPELISDTSRAIRHKDGEKEGVNYYYRSKEEMKNIEFIEYAEYANEIYGLSKREVETKLSIYDTVYAVTELNGIKQIKKKLGDKIKIVVIFVKVSPEVAKERMMSRGDDPEKIKSRIEYGKANKEFDNFIYADYVIDNNGSFESSTEQLLDIVLGKERNKI